MERSAIFNTPPDISELSELVTTLTTSAEVYCEEFDKPGGHFCLANEQGEPIIILRVNFFEFEEGRAARTFAFCQEKIQRLLAHPEHVASWQSHDPDNDQYGGAIRVKGGFLSFSGLPEHADEALCIGLARTFGALSAEEAASIIDITGNSYPYPYPYTMIKRLARPTV